MAVYSLTGQDVIKINARLLTDFGPGEVAKLTYAADIATMKTGKNRNAIIASNETGNQATLEVKVLRGSDDDKFLNSLLVFYRNNQVSFTLMTGEIIKRMGNGQGQVTNDTYLCQGGVFTKMVETVVNVEGDTEQALAMYTIQFAEAPRAIA